MKLMAVKYQGRGDWRGAKDRYDGIIIGLSDIVDYNYTYVNIRLLVNTIHGMQHLNVGQVYKFQFKYESSSLAYRVTVIQ